MSTGNPTFSPSTPHGGEKINGQDRKKTLEEGLKVLSEKVRQIIGDRHATKIVHEGFTDGFADSANYHLFTVDLENNGKVLSVKVPQRNPFNSALRWHTGVDMAQSEEWVYSFDGGTRVEVTDPKGKKEIITLDEKNTLDSLITYLRSTMTREKVAQENYAN